MSSEWTIIRVHGGKNDGGDVVPAFGEDDGGGAAYGAPRRHSRACSGIQRNKGEVPLLLVLMMKAILLVFLVPRRQSPPPTAGATGGEDDGAERYHSRWL